jgi:hypothetical protein
MDTNNGLQKIGHFPDCWCISAFPKGTRKKGLLNDWKFLGLDIKNFKKII